MSESDYVKYSEQNKVVNALIVQSKTDHFQKTLADANAKTMYSTLLVHSKFTLK